MERADSRTLSMGRLSSPRLVVIRMPYGSSRALGYDEHTCQESSCIYTSLTRGPTLRLSRTWKREHSGRRKVSAAAGCSALPCIPARTPLAHWRLPPFLCNGSNLAHIGTMRGRAADGIERVAANEQVEIGALRAKRIIGRCTECGAALPPAMLAHDYTRIEVGVE